MADGEAPATTAAVAMKLPTFWATQPEVWFLQAEAQFALRNITADNTKFHYVVAALDQDTAGRVLNILKSPPAQNKYEALKNRLLQLLTLNDYERASKLLNLPTTGDDKPSAIASRMYALLGDANTDILFRQIFLEQLPQNIRAQLVLKEDEEVTKLAEQADKIWATSQQEISAIELNKVEQKRQRGKARKDKASTSTEGSELCFYHARFGEKATRCRSPCSKRSGNDTTGHQ
jgi:hypothetical protein